MKERPIIMGAESVRAILEGHKTQTRRVIKPQPSVTYHWSGDAYEEGGMVKAVLSSKPTIHFDYMPKCRWQVGDRLWVREAWAQCSDNGILYKADSMFIGCEKGDFAWDWKSPLFMPRWASRITLEITDIRVEQLQDITEGDAIAEGCSGRGGVFLRTDVYPSVYESIPIQEYRTLWNSLNAKRGYPWESNPLVWVIKFKVI